MIPQNTLTRKLRRRLRNILKCPHRELILSWLLLCLCTSLIVIIYIVAIDVDPNKSELPGAKYLVYSPKCQIPDLDPFHEPAKHYHAKIAPTRCSSKGLLTIVEKNNNVATLHIDEDVLRSYEDDLSCCYSEIVTTSANGSFRLSDCEYFKGEAVLDHGSILVECRGSNEDIVYKNVHAPITVTEEMQNKLNSNNNPERFSVAVLGIDSVSRLNFIRSLPETYKMLMDNDWISLVGYNKVDDNTYPNVMAMLTGNNQNDKKYRCRDDLVGGLDACPIIWYDYRNSGYVTAYAEDDVEINPFYLHRKGFKDPPTDYYFRPYLTASESLPPKRRTDCFGPETSGERVLNLAKDFLITYVNQSSFGLFWMNTFSHNSMNAVSSMDAKLSTFLQDITDAKVLENTVLMFLSDHGLRVGDFRKTKMGWYEERLPFLFMWIPHRLRRKFPTEYTNLRSNSHKLTTPYDTYMTLQHLLVLSEVNYAIKPSVDCPKCRSLFAEIDNDRSCEDAGIERHWCTCASFSPVDRNASFVKAAALYVLAEIENVLAAAKEENCAKFSLHKIWAASMSNDDHLLVVFETRPGAVFEATLKYDSNTTEMFRFRGGVSRLDLYFHGVYCVREGTLAKYCYCQE